jgi:hypothetical protein
MLTIQEAHRYLKLSEIGLARKLKCSNYDEHPDLVSWVEENDDVVFMCLACSFKIRPGISMVKYIKYVNQNFKN